MSAPACEASRCTETTARRHMGGAAHLTGRRGERAGQPCRGGSRPALTCMIGAATQAEPYAHGGPARPSHTTPRPRTFPSQTFGPMYGPGFFVDRLLLLPPPSACHSTQHAGSDSPARKCACCPSSVYYESSPLPEKGRARSGWMQLTPPRCTRISKLILDNALEQTRA